MKYARAGLLAVLVLLLSLVSIVQAQGEEPISIGDTVDGELTESSPRALYSLDVTATTEVTITLTSPDFDAYLVLEDSAGNVVDEDDDGAGRLNSQIIIELTPDTYTIVATSLREYSSGGEFFATGAYTLSVSGDGAGPVPTPTPGAEPTPAPTPVEVPEGEEIDFGDTVSGTLSDAPTAEYTFSAAAGDLVTITLTSGDFDAYLFLLDEDGFEVARDDDSAGSLNSRIGPFAISEAGDYTIVVNSYGNVIGGNPGFGDYEVSLAVAEVTTIDFAEPVSDTIDDETPIIVYSIEGDEGDLVSVVLDTDGFNVYATFSGPGGTNLQTFGGPDALGPYTLPADGEYVVTVASYDTFTPERFTLDIQQIVPVAIDYNEVVETNFDTSSSIYLNFDAVAGDAINVVVDSDGTVDTSVTVVGPDGFEVAFDDDGGVGFDPEIRGLILREDGTYSVIVTPYIRGDNGTFTVTVNNNAIPSLDDAFTQVVRLSDKQGVGTVVFEGVAGETVLLSARVLTATTSEPRVEVSQGGEILAANSIGQVSRLLMEFTVPEDGTVEVTVSDFDAESLIVEFSVERMGVADADEEPAMEDPDSDAVEEVDEPEEVEEVEATEEPSDS